MRLFFLFLVMIAPLTAAHAAQPCQNPAGDEGDQVYNITYHVMQYCNGSHWVAMGSIMGQGDNLGDHTAKQAVNMSGFRIENLAAPSAANHAATRAYADTKVGKAGDTMTGALNLSGAPTANAHATSKEYVDNVVASAAGGGKYQISCGEGAGYGFCLRINTETGSVACKRGNPTTYWSNCEAGNPW